MMRRKYKIGKISELIGITPEALRYYEHEGIISPEKSTSSGYRLYDAWDVHILIRARTYRRYGFSLAETVKALNHHEPTEIVELLRKKELMLEEAVREQEYLLAQLQHDRRNMRYALANIGKFRVENCPSMHLINTQQSYDIVDSKFDLYHTWIEKAPYASSGGIFEIIEGDPEENKLLYGLIVEDQYLQDFDESLMIDTVHIPSQKCLTTFFKSGSSKELCVDMFRSAFNFMEKRNLKMTGNPFAKAVLMTRGDDGSYYSWYQGWVPFEGDCEYCSPPLRSSII